MNSLTERVEEKWISYALPFLVISSFFLFWQIASTQGLINPALFPPPSQSLEIFHGRGLISHSELLNHVLSTLFRLSVSFSTATLFGIGMGVLMGLNKYIYDFFDPLITVLVPIPGIAWAPLFIIWIGLGNPNVITVGFLVAIFPIIYNTASGIREIDQSLVNSADIMGADRMEKLKKVFLPASLPYILTGLKLGLARCWRTIIAVEMIVATTSGLGYMIIDASDHLQMSIIYAGIMVLIAIYFLLEHGLSKLEEKTIERWGMVRET